MEQKKILYISTNADEAGAPRHVESLVKAFLNKYSVYCLFGNSGPVADRLIKVGVQVNYVNHMQNSINPVYDMLALTRVFFYVSNIKPDLIHCHSAKAGVIGRIVSAATSIPCVYTVHGWGWRGMPFIKKKMIEFLERCFAHVGLTYYIAVANTVKKDALALLKIPSERCSLIYNGVEQEGGVRDDIRINKFTLFMAARVCAAKDHLTLLQAFGKLDNKYRLILCGSGTDQGSFKESARRIVGESYSRITFVGETSNVYGYLNQCDIFLLISNFEALPMSIIEAMSIGLPVIASDVGGVSEIIDNEMNGILIRKSNVEDLVAGILKLEDDNFRCFLGNSARRKYIEMFDYQKMIKKVDECYNKILGQE